MKSHKKRYVFIAYEDLKKIKFKKLERVCSKIYVLIDAEEAYIPVSLVQQTQSFGKNVKWVAVDSSSGKDITYHLTFLMGQLHEKISKDIEFAILSNEDGFDQLVHFINQEGRNCIRVQRKKTKVEKELAHSNSYVNGSATTSPPMEESEIELEDNSTSEEEIPTFSSLEQSLYDKPEDILEPHEDTDTEVILPEKEIIEETARDTVKRLIRSGNRPSDVSLLKSYILLHNQELTVSGNIDKIIHRLQETKEIDIENQEVIYNF